MSKEALLASILNTAREVGASDIRIAAGRPVRLRIRDRYHVLSAELSSDQARAVALQVLARSGHLRDGNCPGQLKITECRYGAPGLGDYLVDVELDGAWAELNLIAR